MAERHRFSVTGLDCAACVRRVEGAALALPGVTSAWASITTGMLEVECGADGPSAKAIAATVSATGHTASPAEAPRDPAYARVLGWVVGLNLGFGLVEVALGIWAGSQALLADSLDFIGDGLISGLALVALGWGGRARARTALIQGVFLAAMGLGVLAGTLAEVLDPELPQGALMAVTGAVALAVNLICALLLMRHQGGDASARAVWLFSRNDALGNLAVVLAAGLVVVLDSPLPDLLVAGGIALLFLASAFAIIRDARREMVKSGG